MPKTKARLGLLRGVLCVAGLGSSAAQASRGFGEVHVLTTVPSPGSPEGIAVRDQRVHVAGPAKFGTIASGPSVVFAFDLASGQLMATYPVALGHALVAGLWEAGFALDIARKAASRADTTYVAGCLFRAVLLCAHALHGRAGR